MQVVSTPPLKPNASRSCVAFPFLEISFLLIRCFCVSQIRPSQLAKASVRAGGNLPPLRFSRTNLWSYLLCYFHVRCHFFERSKQFCTGVSAAPFRNPRKRPPPRERSLLAEQERHEGEASYLYLIINFKKTVHVYCFKYLVRRLVHEIGA